LERGGCHGKSPPSAAVCRADRWRHGPLDLLPVQAGFAMFRQHKGMGKLRSEFRRAGEPLPARVGLYTQGGLGSRLARASITGTSVRTTRKPH